MSERGSTEEYVLVDASRTTGRGGRAGAQGGREPILAAYRSEPATITWEQMTRAWEAFDA